MENVFICLCGKSCGNSGGLATHKKNCLEVTKIHDAVAMQKNRDAFGVRVAVPSHNDWPSWTLEDNHATEYHGAFTL